ncbi:SEC23 SEC24 family protein [Favolaschia claudopus]|uniref:SEC23 SEC24 family protein n=1 Tax=Favolaschia claudopus TaxID=2862362 RepID=A0AAW0CXP4_9AGAR
MYAHPNHIPQPPHSAGRRFQGFRRKIDPAQVPSAPEAINFDRHQWENTIFQNKPGEHVPLSSSDFISLDQGNASPKFVRMTTWNIPYTSRLANECAIPMVAVLQPFADLDPREEPVPLVDFGERGPARCERCRAYINPWCTWIRGGNAWKCNLCSHETEVSPEYFCNLDANLMRMDHLNRPELNRGTVDFAVPPEYWASNPPPRFLMPYFSSEPPPTGKRKPLPMNFVFALDVSSESLRSGLLFTACAALKDILYGPNACFPPESELAIITFDVTLHFYDLSSDLVPMLIVSDLDEVFLPLRSGLFVKPQGRQAAIEGLLNALPERFAEMPYTDAALGSAIRAGIAGLAGRGGHIIVFQSTIPMVGAGGLPGEPDEANMYDTSKEASLYAPRDNTWRDIGEECVEDGIGVSIFLGMSKYIDVGSIGVVASMTGGELFYHPRFTPERDGAILHAQFDRLIRRTTGYNCTMRVRTSNGLVSIRVNEHHGNFFQRGATDLEFGILDADKALSVTLRHSGGALDPRGYVYLQSALLYTTVEGQRRVRTCNLALPIVELAWNVFLLADLDATLHHLARRAVSQMSSEKLANIREDLTENCSSILLAYRNKCSNTSSHDQLILPEAFKGLPVYTLGIEKSKCLRARNVTSDVRNYYAHRLLSMSVRSLVQLLYPPLLALHDLAEDALFPDETTGRLNLPDVMRDSHLYMSANGVYLIDNGEAVVLWVGDSVSPQILLDLFGVDDVLVVDPQMSALPRLESRLSTQIHNLLEYRRVQRGGRVSKFFIARQNLDAAELEFSDMLVEDQNAGAMAYTDFLSVVHGQIKQVGLLQLRDGGTIGGAVALRGSIW